MVEVEFHNETIVEEDEFDFIQSSASELMEGLDADDYDDRNK